MKPWESPGSNHQQPLKPHVLKFLHELDQMRETLRGMQARVPPHQKTVPDFKLHFSRLDEMERITRFGGPADAERFRELNEDFMLDYQADIAATIAETSERLVRFTDQLAQKVEEKKFELPPETRDAMEELLEPYKDQFRAEMLDSMPIETRRQLEEEKRRLEEET